MTKGTHTPGPGCAVRNHISAKITTVDGSKVFPTIALVDTATTAADRNARLIAAAPELLAALQRARTVLASAAEVFTGAQCDVHGHVLTAIGYADNAIAKATEGE